MPVEVLSPQRTTTLSKCLMAENIYANHLRGRTVERPIGIINQEELGLNDRVLKNMVRYMTFLDGVMQVASNHQNYLSIFLSQFLTEDARIRLNIDQPIPPNYNPFPIGSVIRFDSVLTGNPSSPIRICDINPSLLHYAPYRRLFEMTTRTDKTDPITQTLGQESIAGLANVILTKKRYKVNPQLDWVAERISLQSRKNFQTIDNANYQNSRSNKTDKFGLVVNHTRETTVYRMDSTRPTIYGGIARLIESKLFPRILSEIVSVINYKADFPNDVVKTTTVPSKLLWFMGLDVSTRIDNGPVNTLNPYGKTMTVEDLKEFLSNETSDDRFSCVLKTADSSGTKGVKVIKSESWQDLSKQIHEIGNQMADDVMLPPYNPRNPKTLILQPFYDSRLKIMNREYRIKVDTFLQKRSDGWKVIGSGSQLKSADHLMVHGGGETERLIIPNSWAA